VLLVTAFIRTWASGVSPCRGCARRREQRGLRATQAESYLVLLGNRSAFAAALVAGIASAGGQAGWGAGFTAAAGVGDSAAPEMVIAIRLKIQFFFVLLSSSVLLFRESLRLRSHKKLKSEARQVRMLRGETSSLGIPANSSIRI